MLKKLFQKQIENVVDQIYFPFSRKLKMEKQKQNQCKIDDLLFHREAISFQKSEPLQDTGIPRDFD